MRKPSNSDADRDKRSFPEPAAPGVPADLAPPAEDAPSLVWPPAEDELGSWEVLQVQQSGQTFADQTRYTPPGEAAARIDETENEDDQPTAFVPPTPVPYVPPTPIDDPVGETSLLAPVSSDFDLPETELIEPLAELYAQTQVLPAPAEPGARVDPLGSQPTVLLSPLAHSAARPAAIAPPAPPEDRTVVIPRPAFGPPRTEVTLPPASDDTNAGIATRIIVGPAFAASVGHAPTVPVSALHRSAAANLRPPTPPIDDLPDPKTEPGLDPKTHPRLDLRNEPRTQPRLRMEDTLPAGAPTDVRTNPMIRPPAEGSDDTVIAFAPAENPAASPVLRRVPAGPVGSPSPFSRVGSRGAQPLGPSDPAAPPPPLAFGPRVPTASGSSPALTPVALAPLPTPARSDADADRYAAVGAPIPSRPAKTSTTIKLATLGAAAVIALGIALGLYQYLSMRTPSAAAPAMATLSVDTSPSGADVVIDGKPHGKTPVRLEIPEGQHALDVTLNGATKRVPLVLAAGTITAHSLEFAAPAPAPAAAGDAALEVRSEPSGARIVIDGVARGVTPQVIPGLTSGRHEVQVSGPFSTVTRQVTLRPGHQLRLVVSPARGESPAAGTTRPPAARAEAGTGYISIQSPIVLRVVRNGEFVGTSEDARLSLPAGNQVIGLENESVGFRDVRTVEVAGGKVTPVQVALPNGSISINARPWAEVFVDGARIGETPVSQLALPVGIHEVTFRHPDYPERTSTVIVKIGATGRAFVDFTK